jgi:GNAT superfamily N-acetyltransferase
LILLDNSRFDAVADTLGDTPFTVTPYFFLHRRQCDVYVDDAAHPLCFVILPHVRCADVYVFIHSTRRAKDVDNLADFIARLELAGGLFVPADLLQPIRARRRISLEAEGLCFTYRQMPCDFTVGRSERASRLSVAEAQAVAKLPGEAVFLYQNYSTPAALLAEGLAFGVFYQERLVSVAASLALTPKHCDVGVYTLPRYRSRGYATDCVGALLAEVLSWGVRPLWRIGIRQRLAIYFAEKLGMEEIGATGREVYLQAHPLRQEWPGNARKSSGKAEK